MFLCFKFFSCKIIFFFQNSPSIIILLFLKAKLSIFAWGLIFVDENYLNCKYQVFLVRVIIYVRLFKLEYESFIYQWPVDPLSDKFQRNLSHKIKDEIKLSASYQKLWLTDSEWYNWWNKITFTYREKEIIQN